MLQSFATEIPPTLNEIIRLHGAGRQFDHGGKHYRRSGYSQAKKYWQQRIALEARLHGLQPMDGSVWVHFCWCVRSFGSDPDNVSASAKFILDGLVQSRILGKDSLMVIGSPYTHEFHRAGANQPPWVLLMLADHPLTAAPDLILPGSLEFKVPESLRLA